jgi:hypothetical protein
MVSPVENSKNQENNNNGKFEKTIKYVEKVEEDNV